MRYLMSITAQDRAGIVAAITAGALELNASVEAASQTVHQGYFAMVILWSVPDTIHCSDLEDVVHRCGGADLHVFTTEYHPPAETTAEPSDAFIVTSVGPDKPGILHAMTHYLAEKQINVDDLYCCVTNGEFVVICQVSVPSHLDVFMLQADLQSLGLELGVDIRMQHEDIFVATNELPLRRG